MCNKHKNIMWNQRLLKLAFVVVILMSIGVCIKLDTYSTKTMDWIGTRSAISFLFFLAIDVATTGSPQFVVESSQPSSQSPPPSPSKNTNTDTKNREHCPLNCTCMDTWPTFDCACDCWDCSDDYNCGCGVHCPPPHVIYGSKL